MSLMNRIVWHHAGSTYNINRLSLKHYHGALDGDCQRHDGDFPVLNNAPGRIRKGNYAAHTWKLNTGSIGRSICAMLGHKWSDPLVGKYPVTPAQYDALAKWVAEDAIEWGIPVTRRTILSHAEVQITLDVSQRAKWDYDYDPHGGSSRDPVAIGDEFRQEVLVQMEDRRLVPAKETRRVLRQGMTGDDVALMQRKLKLSVDGAFGPKTFMAVVAFQKRNELLPDGVVGRMTWAALL